MKSNFLAILAMVLTVHAEAQDKKPEQKPEPAATQKSSEKELWEKVSYAVGMNIANAWKQGGVDFDVNEVSKGIKDVLSGHNTKITEQEAREAISQWQTKIRGQQEEKRKQESAKNKKEGEAFLAANAKKPAIKTTPSGLQYQVIREGTGKIPTTNDMVSVHYIGTLINGISFDSTYNRGQPAELPVTGVVKGWTEALQMMKTGSKWKLFVPSNLGYGEQSPPNIPPNSTLIYEMELVDIKAKTPFIPTTTPMKPGPPGPLAPTTIGKPPGK